MISDGIVCSSELRLTRVRQAEEEGDGRDVSRNQKVGLSLIGFWQRIFEQIFYALSELPQCLATSVSRLSRSRVGLR